MIKLKDVGTFSSNGKENVFAAYEIESGYNSIGEWLHSDTIILGENAVLDVLVNTAEKMEQTKQPRGFYFQNINPCTVLWNPQGKVKLLNIGSALLIPKYVCGGASCNKKYHNDEIGATTGVYFLGLLAVQMIAKNECPVITLEMARNSRKKFSFFDNGEITPHLKSIIARMVARPAHRYGDLDMLLKDLRHVLSFVKMLNAIPKEKQDHVGELTLVDFLDFRLKIAERNPEIPIDPLQRVVSILESLSEQIVYYSDQKTIKKLFANNTHVPFINPWIWYWFSPESRTLLKLAFDWDGLLNFLNDLFGLKYSNKLSNMLLGRVVYFEALATIQGLLTLGSVNRESARSFSEKLIKLINNEKLIDLRVKAKSDKYSQPMPSPYANEDLNPIINLFQMTEEQGWIYVLRRLSSRLIFSGINFARHEIDFFFKNETPAFTTVPLFKVKSSSKTWTIHKLPFLFLNKLSSASDVPVNSVWGDVEEIIKYLYLMNPCARKRGMLVDYNALPSPEEGNISFGWNWTSWEPFEANFTEDKVLTLGNILISRGSPRAIQIDFVKKPRRVASVFSYSKIFENLTSSSKVSFESLLAFSMKKHKWFAWVLVAIFALFQYFLSSSEFLKIPSVLQMIVSVSILVFGRLVVDPIWKRVEQQLAIIKPEDKMLEVKI